MFDLDPTVLFFSILFSSIGIGYYAYGKKHSVYFQVAGIVLLLFTFVVSSLWLLLGIGTVLTILPFILERL